MMYMMHHIMNVYDKHACGACEGSVSTRIPASFCILSCCCGCSHILSPLATGFVRVYKHGWLRVWSGRGTHIKFESSCFEFES
jgi:hypothetical protein